MAVKSFGENEVYDVEKYSTFICLMLVLTLYSYVLLQVLFAQYLKDYLILKVQI